MNYAICNETFQNWEWAQTCHQIAELGYAGIEVAPYTLAEDVRTVSADARLGLARTAERAGLSVVGLHWLLVSPPGLSLTDPDDTIRQTTSDYLVALVDFCADLGGDRMVLGSPAQRGIPDGETALTARDRLCRALTAPLDRAHTRHVSLCLEPLPSPEANFILTLAEANSIIQEISHPSLQTILDVKSASSETEPLPSLIERFRAHIAHVHANDVNRRGPGFGATDFVPILKALTDISYQGAISVEVFDYRPDPVTIARESIAYLRRCERAVSNEV